jgi:hypothetical protein
VRPLQLPGYASNLKFERIGPNRSREFVQVFRHADASQLRACQLAAILECQPRQLKRGEVTFPQRDITLLFHRQPLLVQMFELLRRRHHASTQAAWKEKEAKKRMERFGIVAITREAFLAVLKVSGSEE